MISGLFSSIDSALVQKNKFDAISNNIANITTTGFKKDLVSFEQTAAFMGLRQMSNTDFARGNMMQTGNPLDVALESDGFFKIQTQQGTRYTQNGSFQLDDQGFMVTADGDQVMGQGGPIEIGEGVVSITADGQVLVNEQVVDRLAVVAFNRPQDLVKEGACTYSYGGDGAGIIELDEIRAKQGYLESSNVKPTEEMVRMIEMFRSYESNQQIIQTFGEINDKMISGFGLE